MKLDKRLQDTLETKSIETTDSIVVFVDGEIYEGFRVFNSFKGVGWRSGRPVSVELEVPRWADVAILDLSHGKLRPLIFDDQGKELVKSKTTQWSVMTYPQDAG